MAARSHLFPFRTEKLSSLSPMVLNFGRVGSRRFQESISLRLTPFFVRVREQKPAAGLGQPPSTDSCPLRRRQSVTVVRGRCVTFGDKNVWKTPRAERGCSGKKSRGITTEAQRTLREESPIPLRLCVGMNRRCLTGASGRRHERSV